MRVYCKVCGQKGRISSRDELSLEFARLYCQCNSPLCGHTWVANLTFSHTLSPSAQAVDRLLKNGVRPRFPSRQVRDCEFTLRALRHSKIERCRS
ncbi:ogr/Delta-like zinc finger family protein [uncultured Pseudomonas sp.]|uniref:ogr/Delta-like zinc finger family protein n=1 Tax=uncultured Pseudomonas sp. TaxID=114707 RepID=UPI0025E4A5CF|nr:ogr/Delta-like zinc finger family protein [uncultured Pseudomonas sp.]